MDQRVKYPLDLGSGSKVCWIVDHRVKKPLDHGSHGQIPIGSWIQPPCVTPLNNQWGPQGGHLLANTVFTEMFAILLISRLAGNKKGN